MTDKAAGVEVRRNVPLAVAVSVVAGLLTLAFAVRAFSGGSAVDWLALGVLALITIAYVVTLVDSRAPLMVVDERGVRLRDGGTWKGVAWADVECFEHLPRRLPLRDGHLLVVSHDDRQLLVPLTMATRVVGAEMPELSDTLAELADGRADVVEVVPGIDEDAAGPSAGAGVPMLSTPVAIPAPADLLAASDPALGHQEDLVTTGEIAPVTESLRPSQPVEPAEPAEPAEPVDTEDTTEIVAEVVAETPAPGRTTIFAARVDRDGTSAPRQLAEPVTDLPAYSSEGDHHETVVLEELAVRPAPRPVIGPELSAARERVHLSIDQLSERTRIRPHVIEAIEVDDFSPCGGDFYARGHLRTLSRVLGIDAGPLVTAYDNNYADAPVDPRRVFESELATGHGGSIRSTRGGRNWSVLISAVMGAVLVWSVARLVLGGPAPIGDTPVLNQSGGIAHGMSAKADPVEVVLNAAHGGARLVVRDANGRVVLDGPLAFGQSARLKAVAPVRVWSSDGSVTVAIDGKPAKALGQTGEQASATFIAR